MVKKIVDIVELASDYQGINISGYDDSFLEKSIRNRLAINNILSLSEYWAYLKENRGEAELLTNSLRNTYSEFFRNPITFAFLEQFVLPMVWSRKEKERGNEIRIWSAACASGQEAYSLAILFDEMKVNFSEKIDFRIFATDHNPDELAKAQEGNYAANTLNKVGFKRMQTYFHQTGDTYAVSPRLKMHLDFSWFDLISDLRSCPAPSIYGNFDLVMCSNLLFYYKPEIRQLIIEKIGKTLAPDGFLITGEAERDILLKHNYLEVFENSAIFKKRMH
jgi:chemotaxis protein methyltransferase CheR